MFKTIFKKKDIRNKFLLTIILLFITRIGVEIPIPFINKDLYREWLGSLLNNGLGFMNAFTGGSLENMSIFALSITPYITASIIIQLLTIAIPKLEEIQKDGKSGEEKFKKITFVTAIGLSLLESVAISIGFYKQGFINSSNTILACSLISVILTISSMFLILIGELITKKGIGNGISLILTINILSRIPNDLNNLFQQFVFKQKTIAFSFLNAFIILGIILGLILFIVIMNGGIHRIPVTYSRKINNNKMSQVKNSSIDLKVNTAGVIPIIFATSILQFPIVISQLIGKTSNIFAYLNSSYWFNPSNMKYTLGYLLYVVLMLFFTYFYTTITFNTKIISENIKKSGGVISGIRPGKSTQEYLDNINKNLLFIGFLMMLFLSTIPFVLSGLLKANVSFGGTSLIIVVCVLLETYDKLKALTLQHQYGAVF